MTASPNTLRQWADEYEDATRTRMRRYADAWAKQLAAADALAEAGTKVAGPHSLHHNALAWSLWEQALDAYRKVR